MNWYPIYNPPNVTDIYILRCGATGVEYLMRYSTATFRWSDAETGKAYAPINSDKWKPRAK
jgi:hypothetical protein